MPINEVSKLDPLQRMGSNARQRHGDAEPELVADARMGDRDALSELYRRHSGATYTLALRLCGNHATANDLVQDAFLRAFDRLGSFRADAPFVAWLRRIVANVAADHFRRERLTLVDIDSVTPLAARENRVGDEMDALGLLAQLATPARMVLVLYELEGHSHQEIADLLGRTETWSKTTLSRARSRLRELIGQ